MNELTTKLSSLGYEIVGTLLPGALASVCLSLWLAAIGPLLPEWSWGVLPVVHLDGLLAQAEELSALTSSAKMAGLLMAWYLLGYVLSWGSRTYLAVSPDAIKARRTVIAAMRFKPLRSNCNYDETYALAYQRVCQALREPGAESAMQLPWPLFFQAVRPLIQQRIGSYSLITTHQLKYTFYRSMTTLSAIVFWLSLTALGAGYLLSTVSSGHPDYTALTVLTLVSACMTWGFAESFAYSWRMFGNTIVTEAFAVFVLSKRLNEAPPLEA